MKNLSHYIVMGRRLITVALAFATVADLCHADTAPPVLNPDPMTVSGRFGIPKADKHITHHRLKIEAIDFAPETAPQAGTDIVTFRTALEKAVHKSLNNHALLAADNQADAIKLRVTFKPVQITPQMPEKTATKPDGTSVSPKPDATLATAELTVEALGADAGVAQCVTYTATGRFKALHRLKSGGERRAFGIIIGVLVAAANPYAINTFTGGQLEQANQQNAANNAFRTVAENEGAAPTHAPKDVVAYATQNAIQLALYDYIHHINHRAECLSPLPLTAPVTVAEGAQNITPPPISDVAPAKIPAQSPNPSLEIPIAVPATTPEPKT